MFQLNQKVTVTRLYNRERKSYPWMPDLVGKQGTIYKIQTETTVSHSPLEDPIYWVKFDKPFKVGNVPENEGVYDYHPVEWRDEINWCFVDYLK